MLFKKHVNEVRVFFRASEDVGFSKMLISETQRHTVLEIASLTNAMLVKSLSLCMTL